MNRFLLIAATSSLHIDDNAHAAGRGDADVVAGARRCASRRRYRSGARWSWSWSRSYGAWRLWPSLWLGPRPRASLWMVTWQASRVAFDLLEIPKAGNLDSPGALSPGGKGGNPDDQISGNYQHRLILQSPASSANAIEPIFNAESGSLLDGFPQSPAPTAESSFEGYEISLQPRC